MCHVTNRTFLFRARFHLFKRVHLHEGNICKFIQLRDSKDTLQALGLVRAIDIYDGDQFYQRKLLIKLLTKVGPYLSEVTTLVVKFIALEKELAGLISDNLSNLKILHINDSLVESPHTLYYLIARYPTLRQLKLYSLVFVLPTDEEKSLADAKSIFCSPLNSLSLNLAPLYYPPWDATVQVSPILKGLLDYTRATQIRKLRVTGIEFKDVQHVKSILYAARQGLQNIYVGYHEHFNATQSECPNFTTC